MSLRYACSIALVSLVLLPLQASAQEYYVDDVITSDASGSIYGANMPLSGIPGGYFWARGDFGERPGVDGNYFSTGAFAPANIWGQNQLSFVEGQIFVNDEMGPGGDIGLGHRFLGQVLEKPYAIGVNGFLTWDESTQGSRNRRGSLGVEVMTDWVHANANYYLPFDTTPDRIGVLNRTKESQFVGTNLVFLNRQMAEQQMEGADFEVGVQVPYFEWMTVAGGGYKYNSDLGDDFSGSTLRLGVDMTSAIFDLTLQKDSKFGTSINFGTELRVGSGGIVMAPNYRNLDNKINDRVRKRSRIALQQVELVDNEIAINPATNMPFNIIHVDNTAAAGGDGSNDNRFNRLDLANGPNGDIILVHRGTTSRTNLLQGGTGLNLDNNQIIIGEGTPFLLQAANRPVACPLPGVDQMGTHPFITADASANVINLANNNRVLGLNIISPTGGNAIGGNGASNFIINDINQNITALENTGAGGGIVLNNATGTGRITDYSFRGTNTTTAAGGIVIHNVNQTPLELMIDDVAFLEGGIFGVDLVATNSRIDAQINDVQASMNSTGIRMGAHNAGQVNTTISNSNFNNATGSIAQTGYGIELNGTTNGMINSVMSNVNATGAARDAFHAELDNATGVVNLINGALTGATDDTVDAQLRNGGSLNLALNNVTGGMSGDAGMEIDATDNSNFIATLTSSNFTPTGGDGINTVLGNNSTANITATNSSFSNAGGDGLFVNSQTGSQFNGSFTDGSFANAGQDGVDLNFGNSTGNTLVLNRTNANNAMAGDGFKYSLDSGSNFIATLTDVSLDSATMGNAFNGSVVNNSTANITGTRVSGMGAGGDAIRSRTNLSSTHNVTLSEAGSFSGAGSDGLDLGTTNNSNSTFNISSPGGPVDFSGASTGFGLLSQTANTSNTVLNFASGANFNGAGMDAINLGATNLSTASLTGPNFSGMMAGGDGISLNADNSTITTNLTNLGDFSMVTDDGIQYFGTNGATLNMTFTGVPGTPANFSNAGARGVNGLLTGSTATLNLTDTNFNMAGLQGLLNVSNNSTYIANLTDSTFVGATGTALAFIQSNGASDDINLDNVNASMSTGGHGLFVSSSSGSTADVDVTNGLNVSNSNLDAINLGATGMSTVTLDGASVNGMSAGDDGIEISANNSRIDLTLSAGNFSMSTGDGLVSQASNGATTNINVSGTNFNDAAMMGTGHGVRTIFNDSMGTLNLTNVTMDNAGLNGFGIEANNSTVTSALNTITMNNAGGNAFNIVSTNMSNVNVTGSAMSGSNAGNDGIRIVHDNATTDVRLTNVGNFSNAGNDAVNAMVSNGVHPNFNLDIIGPMGGPAANFSGAGNHGFNITLNNYVGFNAGDPVFRVTGANFNNAGQNGFNLDSNGVVPGAPTTFNGLVTNSTFNEAGNHGLALDLAGSSPMSRMLFTGITALNATVDGLNANATNMTLLDLDVLTIGGGGAGLAGAGDDIFEINQDGGSFIDFIIN